MPSGITPFVSSTFSRATGLLSRGSLLGNINSLQSSIMIAQQQLSSGLRLLSPSTDPLAANRVFGFQEQTDRNEHFLLNIQRTMGRFTQVESSTGRAKDILDRAREILITQVQGTATADTRRLAAVEIDEMIREAVSLGNTKVDGKYVFAGSGEANPAYRILGDGVVFDGDSEELEINISSSTRISATIQGTDVFGGLSQTIGAGSDLNPDINGDTKLRDLRGGEGIRLSSLEIGDAPGTVTRVDLTHAERVSDIIDAINDGTATHNVTAAINATGDGITLTGVSGTVIARDVDGGRVSEDLGIQTAFAGNASPVVGTDLDPILTGATPLALLNSGAGIDPSGFIISNSTSSQTYQSTIDPSAMTSVEELVRAINASDTYVLAELSDNGQGIQIRSRLSGGRLEITENGGTTAGDLGIFIAIGQRPLDDLNNGQGIDRVDGDDFRITDRNGATYDIDILNAQTIQDVVDAINNHPSNAGEIVASASSAGGIDRIIINDTTAGAGNLVVENLNGSYAAHNLGIEADVAAATINGTDLAPVGMQPGGLLTTLIRLREALIANDESALNRIQPLIDQSDTDVLSSRATIGGRVLRLELSMNRTETQQLNLQELMGRERDADLAETATRLQLQQTVLESALSAASQILNTSLLNFI